jgi:hypothetical protein
MDPPTLKFLQAMREQVRGNEHGEGDQLNVHTGDAAQAIGMDAGGPEYQRRVADLTRDLYIVPHPNETQERYGVYRITPLGIARADQG